VAIMEVPIIMEEALLMVKEVKKLKKDGKAK
jgi:hypothetical protein